MSKKTFNDLATGTPKSWPAPTTIAGLARALSVPDDTIVLAIAASLGVPVRTHTSLLALQLPASADLLTPSERGYIVGIVKSLTAGRGDPDAPEESEAHLAGEVAELATSLGDQIDGGK
ncbi:hypothetical protein [Tsukamurella sp. 1534]|uniref:hypothetical protein n=1 Tax=Tsukamurella sp. 1534 TaxID=1151061 RepID=UPI0011D27F04|nr:hypothetical protein [Tsukamurella sp. 1534]